jgi:hypothetical protein
VIVAAAGGTDALRDAFFCFPKIAATRSFGGRMNNDPFIRMWVATVDLWASSWQFAANAMSASPQRKRVAIDPKDPAADIEQGPSAVRSAGPEAMRSDNCPDWDKVDQAADESFPASDPPAR